jgi:hypothetical protein
MFGLGAIGCGSSGSTQTIAPPSTSTPAEGQAPRQPTPGTGASNPLQPGEHIDKAHDNTIVTSRIPTGQSVRGDSDADNPSDIDGNGDADGSEDSDDDNPTPASYRFPDADDKAVFAYGHPAGASEAKQIKSVVVRYFLAGARADGAGACALLVPTLAGSVSEDFGIGARPSYLRPGESCAPTMSAVFEHHHAELVGTIHVIEIRVDGGTAQAIVVSGTMPAGELLLEGRNGRWTIEQLFAGTLP